MNALPPNEAERRLTAIREYGSITAAAEFLGLSVSTLAAWCKTNNVVSPARSGPHRAMFTSRVPPIVLAELLLGAETILKALERWSSEDGA